MNEPNGMSPAGRDRPVSSFHDPEGPVVVEPPAPIAATRDALGPGAWIQCAAGQPGIALLVTEDPAHAAHAADVSIPVVIVVEPGAEVPPGIPGVVCVSTESLPAWLRTFADGALVTGREAQLVTWLDAVRTEEEANQREARRIDREARRIDREARRIDREAQRLAREAEAAARRQMDELTQHIAAIEASRSWRLARRLVGLREAVAGMSPRRLLGRGGP